MIARHRAAAALLPLWLATAGCGINQLRVEHAQAVADSTAAAGDGAQAFLAQVDAARVHTSIALAVADPACARAHPAIRALPDFATPGPPSGALCVARPLPDDPRTLSTAPLGPDLLPTLRLAQALGAYGAGLAAIVEDRNPDPPSRDFVDALTIARAVQTTLTGSARPPVPAPDDPRVQAAAKLIDFLGGLEREAATVRKLRAYVLAHPDAITAVLSPLERQIGVWDTARKGDAGLRLIVADWNTQRVMVQAPPATPDERRAALETFFATQDANAAEARLAPALLQALEAVRSADADLRRVLDPKAVLTRAERRRVAALNRERLITAFTDIASLASAIRSA